MLKRGILKNINPLIYLFVSGIVIIFYLYLRPPGFQFSFIISLPGLKSLPGDLPSYLFRFTLSFLLFGVVPALTMWILGDKLKDMGFSRSRVRIPLPLTLLFLAGFAAAAVLNAYAGPMGDFYPYSKYIGVIFSRGEWWILPIHFLLYILLYYLPWEFLFRGIMILPFLKILDRMNGLKKEEHLMFSIAVASFQAIPSALIHIQHPFPETFAALPFGIFLGYLAVRTRSIIPGLILHIVTGLALDLVLIIQ
jgi:membrane protease YdiL (CAAX protease family)